MPSPIHRANSYWFLLAIAFPLTFLAAIARADDPSEVRATAPPKSVVLQYTRGGAYYIAEPLKEEYDKLLARVRTLQAGLDSGRVDAADVLRELTDLQTKLDKLRGEIETKKVLVSPLKVHTQKEEVTFDLGPERLLVVTADDVRVIGWDQPQVKCVLARTVLAPDDKPVDDHLKALRVVHHHGPAVDVVGKSPAEREADERKFLESADGKNKTPEQLKPRRDLLREIAENFAPYAAFQGKPIDVVEIEGLTHEQGNRQITVRIDAPNGGGSSLGSDWQRFAALTVYVPACKAIAVRGCLGTFDVHGVKGDVLLTSHGSQDRDYNGTFAVRDITGSLTVIDVPVDAIEQVHGPVNLRCIEEMVNTGTTHDRGLRTLYTPPPRVLTCSKIDGDLTAVFVRSDLKLETIAGKIDVWNEFGDTSLSLKSPPAAGAHRVVTESGKITLTLPKTGLGKVPLLALTNCGTVRTDADQRALEDTSFGLGRGDLGTARHWRGLKSKQQGDDFFTIAERVPAILKGEKRPAGLDLISRGGMVDVRITP